MPWEQGIMLVESSEASFPDDSTRSTPGNAVLKRSESPSA